MSTVARSRLNPQNKRLARGVKSKESLSKINDIFELRSFSKRDLSKIRRADIGAGPANAKGLPFSQLHNDVANYRLTMKDPHKRITALKKRFYN